MAAFVENVHANPSVAPVIAITEVGNLKPSNSLNCGLAFEDTTNRPVLKISNANGDTVEEEDTSRKESGKRYLILRNKKSNKVSIFGMKMTYFKKPDHYKTKTYEANPSLLADEEFNSMFGTKKSARISKSRTNDVVDASTDVFDNISTSGTMQSSFSQCSEFLLYLPQGCNRFSDKIETIYPVSTLLHENEIDLMTDYAKEVLSMLPIPVDNEDLSKFFITSINRLCHKTIPNICLLTLADGLIELLKQKTGTLNHRSETVYPNSEVINDKLMDNFVEYSVTGRDLTSKMKDKAVCHIIIILISINMNVFDLSWVSPFLPPSSQKRLILLMKVVGATPTKEDKTKFTLKLPLASLPSFKRESKRSR